MKGKEDKGTLGKGKWGQGVASVGGVKCSFSLQSQRSRHGLLHPPLSAELHLHGVSKLPTLQLEGIQGRWREQLFLS